MRNGQTTRYSWKKKEGIVRKLEGEPIRASLSTSLKLRSTLYGFTKTDKRLKEKKKGFVTHSISLNNNR